MMNNDMGLVREYAACQSEQAFETLVSRHIGLVHSAALRQVRNAHLAEEITQTVFIILARKAGSLNQKTILPGWLYRTTRYVSAAALKIQHRRERREQEAHMEAMIQQTQADSAWEQLAPLLDDVMAQLRDTDRDAIVLRYFKNKSLRDVGAMLGVNEYAAQKRVGRAVEKLRSIFVKRGIVSTTAIITGAISANSVQAAPVALAKSVTAAAIANGAAASGSTLTLIKGALKIMAWTKMKSAIVIAAVALAGAGTTTLTVKMVSYYREESIWDNITGTDFYAELKSAQPAVSIRPTRFTREAADFDEMQGKSIGVYQPFESLLAKAYNTSPCRVLALTPLPPGDFDFITSVPQRPREALQKMIQQKFGITGRRETRETDVLLLTVKRYNAPGLKPTSSKAGSSMSSEGIGHLSRTDGLIDYLIYDLQYYLQVPVVDRTGLAGRFDVDLTWDDEMKWDGTGHYYFSNPDGLKQVVLDQLGLELVPSREPVEMLVVEKVK
jgi:uncharacterized protein (TIGR03435 family)